MLPTAKVCLKLVMETNDAIDEIAIHFFPKDGPKDVYPVQTTGDGNCLANALAHLLLGEERMNVEIRVRATFIAVLRDSDFLNHDVLARNCPDGTENRPCSYAHYSVMLTPEITHLNENSIRTLYQRDVMANRINFNYMGIWQIHHICEAYQRPVGCEYPWHTNKTLWKDMNRIIMPISCQHDMKRPVFIMWTPV